MSSHPSPARTEPLDADWRAIEELLDHLAEIAKSPLPEGELYRRLLDRLVPALGAAAGAVWTAGREGAVCPRYQVNLAAGQGEETHTDAGRQIAHVEAAIRSGEARLVPPRPGDAGDNAAENQSNSWLVVHPFRISPGAWGAVELVGRAELTAAEGRGYQRVLAAVVELIEDFHRNVELGALRRRELSWDRYEQFCLAVHRTLDIDKTACLIANEGRRVIGCDRVSVLIRPGSKCRAAAVSGVDTLDRRAKVVRVLERLANACAGGGDPLWHSDAVAEMPDELARPLEAFLDESHARAVAVFPLVEPQTHADSRPRVVGVLVAERFQGCGSDVEFRERVGAVAAHSAVAVSNSLTHSRLPLGGLGRLLARLRRGSESRGLRKTSLVLAALSVVIAAVAMIPVDFEIAARGELQPRLRRDVFASDDGVINRLLVDHGQRVRAGEPLLEIRKPQLDLEFRRVAGEMQTAEKKLSAVQAERLEGATAGPDARRRLHQLAADEEELKAQLQGLAQQRAVLERQQSDLTVRSPIDGETLTWNLKQSLEARPVQRGQTLLTVGNLEGSWVAELRVRDEVAGFVLAAREALQPDLHVSFALASDPGKVYQGKLTDMALAAELDDEARPSVLATVEFDRHTVSGLRPASTVIARIHCGRAAIGYVWLHEVFHFVQSHWWW